MDIRNVLVNGQDVSFQMKKEILYINKWRDFSQVLKDNGYYDGLIPGNIVGNKKLPGIGVTAGEIEAPRHSIIIEPFLTVIEVKKEHYGHRLCVVTGSSGWENKLKEHLNDDSIPFKKIMTTPESFYKIIGILAVIDDRYRNNYFLLFDECEKVITDSIFRKKITDPLPEFFRFRNKAMISATAIIPSNGRFAKEGFKYLDFRPTYSYKKKAEVLITNNIRTTLRNVLRLFHDDNPVMVFTNATRHIIYTSQLSQVKNNFRVFCADALSNRCFKTEGIKTSSSNKEQRYAQYNFFTSRFFSAVDMLLPKGKAPHIVVITDVQTSEHSIIDPVTDAIQIYGRCRNGVSSFTHITNLFENRSTKDLLYLKEQIDQDISFVSSLYSFKRENSDPCLYKASDAIINKSFASDAFNTNGNFNDFWRDNLIYSEVVKNHYTSVDSLSRAYEQADFFDFSIREVSHGRSDLDVLVLQRMKGKMKRKHTAMQLLKLTDAYNQYLNDGQMSQFEQDLNDLKAECELTYTLFFSHGWEFLESIDYSLIKMKRALFAKERNDGKNLAAMTDEILSSFQVNSTIEGNNIKVTLQGIYDRYFLLNAYGKIQTAKATDILQYFECKVWYGKEKDSRGKYPTLYKLTKCRYRISSHLSYLRSY